LGNTVSQTTVAEPKTEVPAKFKNADGSVNVDALTKAYSELEKKQGSGTQQPAQQTQSQQTQQKAEEPTGEINLTIEDATEALTSKGLDHTKYATEFATAGHLSSQSYADMLSKGLTVAQIDAFLASQAPAIAKAKAAQAADTNEVVESVGGKAEYGKLMEYAKANYTPEQKLAFNQASRSGNKIAIKAMLSQLKSEYDASLGQNPDLGNGGKQPTGSKGDIFSNRQAYQDAVRDPRYKVNPSYRAEIDAKLARSRPHWG
jgi:hypothetical protein